VDWKVPFFRHDLGHAEIDALATVLKGDVLTTGDTTAEFERRFAALLGRRHALGTKSCTAALHLSLLALGIGPGDEVITTPLSWLATAAAVLHAGATPVFVDVEPDTGNMDAARVAAAITPRTRAILPVHLYGLMCDMKALRAIADRHRLHLIEDAAHCVEGEREGIRPGELSAVACFSFYATKSLSCGEGGGIVCEDDALHERLRLLRLAGVTRTGAERAREGYQPWDMVALGYKENMSNIEAALLLPQLERLAAKHARRQQLADRYAQALASIPELTIPASRPDTVHARHLFTIWIDRIARDDLIEQLKAEGIGCVVNFLPIHLTTYFSERFGYRRGAFPVAEHIAERTLSLPFYPDMPAEHVDIVAGAIARALAHVPEKWEPVFR
jgi:dTDP-4-amino-4,6-dideoxygalactose transaminase